MGIIKRNKKAMNIFYYFHLQDWSSNYDICNLCKENLNIIYDFRELCFKNKFTCQAVELKEIQKIETLQNNNVEIESSDKMADLLINDSDDSLNVTEESNLFKCQRCLKTYGSNQTLQKHLRVKHSYVECKYCNKEFENVDIWLAHISETHDIAFKHKCRICSKSFSMASLLKIHLRDVHLNVQSFQCMHCSKEFKVNVALQRHLNQTHGIELKYKCKICPKTFPNPYSLKRHLPKHSDYEFKCDQCRKKFRSNVALQGHLGKKHGISNV